MNIIKYVFGILVGTIVLVQLDELGAGFFLQAFLIIMVSYAIVSFFEDTEKKSK